VLVDSHGLGKEVPGRVMSYVLVRLPLLNRVMWAVMGRSRRMIRWSLRTVFHDPQVVTKSLVDEVFRLAKKPGAGEAWRSWQRSEIGWSGFFAGSRFIAHMDERFDYKHERQANLSQIRADRWNAVTF
jgi:hypothetical protein